MGYFRYDRLLTLPVSKAIIHFAHLGAETMKKYCKIFSAYYLQLIKNLSSLSNCDHFLRNFNEDVNGKSATATSNIQITNLYVVNINFRLDFRKISSTLEQNLQIFGCTRFRCNIFEVTFLEHLFGLTNVFTHGEFKKIKWKKDPTNNFSWRINRTRSYEVKK